MLHKTWVAIRFRAKNYYPKFCVSMQCGADGRSGGRPVGVRSRDCQIFSDE